MKEHQAIQAFAALSQETRLRVVRILVKSGRDGMAAGAIAEAMAVSPSNVSFHLKELEHAGLIAAKRDARSIVYTADFEIIGALVRFLMEDCCSGHPDICQPLLNTLVCCPPASKEAPMTDRIYNVLFLCTGNSARSILAESILNKEGKGRFNAFSAGSHPKGEVHPMALKVLKALDYPHEGFSSKSWEVFAPADAPQMDFIFTVCDNAAGEVCPVWPGHPMNAHWGIEDPASVEGTEVEQERAFSQAARFMKSRISAFVSLPISSIDKMALQNSLTKIGTLAGATQKAQN
jgi:ArsR family transcriptional regulator, arsenate/arsenite/antimonite-responsive transcriptional repressor / arsenate reductase (thioredoxin)